MFWECHIVTSSIDKLLDQPPDQVKLQDFLDESDLVQECLNQNKRLLDYLIQGDIMSELIKHLITLPIDENFRNANIVSELLSGDFQRLQEKLLEKEHLDLLYSFLSTKNNPATLNPILASYFARIYITLLIRKPIEFINYLKSCETFKGDFLRHLDSTSITDILYRLIADSGEQRSDTIKWYEEINLIDDLMQQFLTTESKSVQINIENLLSEFLRLAFDQQAGGDGEFTGSSLSSTIERLLYNRNDNNEESTLSRRLSSNSDDDKKSTNADTEEQLTPVILAQHILSKSNLEQLFDTLTKRPTFVANGCDFLDCVLDLLSRHMLVPISITLPTIGEPSSSDKDDSERMQINDEEETLPVIKSDENKSNETNIIALISLTEDPLVCIYLTLLEVIPSRLPSLIALLSSPCASLIPSSNDSSQTVKYQFISEPLGSMRLNLIKFFSKLIYTISNDYTGDNIYQIFNSNRLFHILIDLLHRHIYNNFLHTQVYLIIRLIIHINSIAVKRSTDIWTRTSLPVQDQLVKSELSNSSPFHYSNRCSYKLFQSLLTVSEVNLFERLLDQYEINVSSNKSIRTSSSSDDGTTSSSLQTRFTSPNSGHIAQILRCLRDHSSTFDNYSSFLKSAEREQIDDTTNVLEMRWQTALDYLTEDEKKWSAMHLNERNNARTSSAMNDGSDADYRRQTFHLRSFGGSGTPYVDEDDDDNEVERFDIDDESMNNDQTTNERKVVEMKKISFEPQFPSVFDEQSLWYEQNNPETKISANNNDDLKDTSPPILPDLFENHRIQQEKHASSTESNFEQLCSLRANDNGTGSGLFPFHSSSSSSTIRDEAITKDDVFWSKHQIHLANANENQRSNIPHTKSVSSSSEEDSDNDDELKAETIIPDDETFFVDVNMETNKRIEANNMMDIFRCQPSISNNSIKDDIMDNDEPISSSTPERDSNTQNISPSQTDYKECRKSLSFVDQNGEMNSDDDDDDDDGEIELQDNFSFLIAKGMLKPTSF